MSYENAPRYYPRYLPEGKPQHDEEEIICSERPQIGEFVNQSGLYSKVITILQHFDSAVVEVFLQPIGDSKEFLRYLNESGAQNC